MAASWSRFTNRSSSAAPQSVRNLSKPMAEVVWTGAVQSDVRRHRYNLHRRLASSPLYGSARAKAIGRPPPLMSSGAGLWPTPPPLLSCGGHPTALARGKGGVQSLMRDCRGRAGRQGALRSEVKGERRAKPASEDMSGARRPVGPIPRRRRHACSTSRHDAGRDPQVSRVSSRAYARAFASHARPAVQANAPSSSNRNRTLH